MAKKVRILCIDGGGILGIIGGTVLQYVEARLAKQSGNPNARVADYFDLIVGTSTGGILAFGYLTPPLTPPKEGEPTSRYSATDMVNLYVEHGFSIFNASKRRRFLFGLLNATQYSPKNLTTRLQNAFGDVKTDQLLSRGAVTTFNMSSGAPVLFGNLGNLTSNASLLDATLSTSAAPTYFPPHQFKDDASGEQYVNIDGGILENNPAMAAYALARGTVFPQVEYPTAKDMLILSLGLDGGGSFPVANAQKSSAWGYLNWGKTLPLIALSGNSEVTEQQINSVFTSLDEQNKFNYKRVQVPQEFARSVGNFDDASPEHIETLQSVGHKTVEGAQKSVAGEYTLDQFVDLLL